MYKSERNVMWKIWQRKKAGRSPGTVKREQCRATGTKLMIFTFSMFTRFLFSFHVMYIVIKFNYTAIGKLSDNGTILFVISYKLNWHVLCNVKEMKKFSRLLQNKFDVLDYSTLLVFTCHVLTDMVRVIEVKIILKMTWRETKITSS